MNCSKCNNEIQKGFKFCPICGTPVIQEIKCPKCGSTDIPQDSKFCPDCGALLGVNQEEAQRRFENAKKQEEEKARKRKQAEFAKQQEIDRKRELERKAQESKRAELEKAKREAEAKKRAEETKKTYINGHEYVDLGLPSHTLWATHNIGANKPEDCGDFYAWGETSTKTIYTLNNYKNFKIGLFGVKLRDILTSSDTLQPSFDVAKQKWGDKWHMPTTEQINELVENTISEWTQINGVDGCLLKSKKNGKSIFFPAAGFISDGKSWDKGTRGHYLGAGISYLNGTSKHDIQYCRGLGFYREYSFAKIVNISLWIQQVDNGNSVRPVSDSK